MTERSCIDADISRAHTPYMTRGSTLALSLVVGQNGHPALPGGHVSTSDVEEAMATLVFGFVSCL